MFIGGLGTQVLEYMFIGGVLDSPMGTANQQYGRVTAWYCSCTFKKKISLFRSAALESLAFCPRYTHAPLVETPHAIFERAGTFGFCMAVQ